MKAVKISVKFQITTLIKIYNEWSSKVVIFNECLVRWLIRALLSSKVHK